MKLVARVESLDHHLVLNVLVPLVLLVFVAVAAHGDAVLGVVGNVRRERVDALRVQRRQGPRERFRLELGHVRMPGRQVP